MPGATDAGPNATTGSSPWYELFSRGARDWLRHNDKVREAVRDKLPQIIANAEVLTDGSRSVRVPVRMLEHYQFRLRRPYERSGAGQGQASPGDVLAPPGTEGEAAEGSGSGGRDDGGVQLMLEFQVEDIAEWLWEEMRLPNLQPRAGPSEESSWVREGIDRRGARSRLDRRRSLKEAVKRRAVSGGQPPFADEDLRYRQLARRPQPALRAVVIFLLDVSGSVSERERQLAKTFFFWVVQGLRREYRQLETVFVAHTTQAWEFTEADFFRVSGSGGTVASSGFAKVRELIADRFSPSATNIYLFYASDGDNAVDDRAEALSGLSAIAQDASYCGYLEVSSIFPRHLRTEMGVLFSQVARARDSVGSFSVSEPEEIWAAVRHFFRGEAAAATGAARHREA